MFVVKALLFYTPSMSKKNARSALTKIRTRK